MLLIDVVQEYWDIQEALRVTKKLQNHDFPVHVREILTLAIISLQSALIEKEAYLTRLMKKNNSTLFDRAEGCNVPNPDVDSILTKLKEITSFNEEYLPLYNMHMKFREFVEAEHKMIMDYGQLAKLKKEFFENAQVNLSV